MFYIYDISHASLLCCTSSNQIEDIRVEPDEIMISFDVVSLFVVSFDVVS